jgi:hypothetical protein
VRCELCQGEYNRLEVIFPPVPSQELKPTKDGDALRHVRTGELYHAYTLCESCLEAIKAHGGGMIALPFKLKENGGEKKNERKEASTSGGVAYHRVDVGPSAIPSAGL